MITRPSPTQVAAAARRELAEVVLPAVEGAPARVALQMLDNVLHNLGVRAEHEVAWMREEAEAVDGAASELLGELPDGAEEAALRRALDAYREGLTTGAHWEQVQADYDRAGEVLSCLIEATARHGTAEQQAEAFALLQSRNEHELEIMGEFGFVGRG